MPSFNGAGPLLLDDFNRANSISLGSTSVGAVPWLEPLSVFDDGCQILSNELAAQDAGNPYSNCYLSGPNAKWGPGLLMSFKVGTVPAAGDSIIPQVRLDQTRLPFTGGATDSPYFQIEWDVIAGAGNDTVAVVYNRGGFADIPLTRTGSNTGFDIATGDVLGFSLLEVAGASLLVAYRNGASLCSFTTSDADRPQGPGTLGIYLTTITTPGTVQEINMETVGAPLLSNVPTFEAGRGSA